MSKNKVRHNLDNSASINTLSFPEDKGGTPKDAPPPPKTNVQRVSESWLNPEISSSLVSIPNFKTAYYLPFEDILNTDDIEDKVE
ncbi:hypothetical protein J437_LFUL006999 [Ladona fulva]|uniref:Uncharacterized protein n=1 Tax=Ladona fulva TaxID=123851 RepID=A0A8K0K3K0_LADFU|nr:hypothetical protein J437_LFUL006999 [Ladona fulva]